MNLSSPSMQYCSENSILSRQINDSTNVKICYWTYSDFCFTGWSIHKSPSFYLYIHKFLRFHTILTSLILSNTLLSPSSVSSFSLSTNTEATLTGTKGISRGIIIIWSFLGTGHILKKTIKILYFLFICYPSNTIHSP